MERKSGESKHSRSSEAEEHQLDDEAVKAAKDLGDTAVTHTSDEEIDDLLNEIDEVLESNAEEFVRGFIQKGGQ